MTDSRKDSLVLEKSLPDGNCAFNAFVLGWCSPPILNAIDNFRPPSQYPRNIFTDFLQQSAKALGVGVASWFAIKNKLLLLRLTNNVVPLQTRMAPVFRHLSIKLARHNHEFQERMKLQLKSAFRDYVMPIKKSVDDDIFSRHSFIMAKFAEFNPAPRSIWSLLFSSQPTMPTEQSFAEANKKMLSWWDKTGQELFFQQMEQPKIWAGAGELELAADYFDLDFVVFRKNIALYLRINRGEVERNHFNSDQIFELRNRGLVDAEEKNDKLRFLPFTSSQVVERLNALPDVDKIRQFVWDAGASLKGKEVPADWKASLQQLIQRNIVSKKDGRYVFDCDANTAACLLEEFPEKEKMLSIWKAKYIDNKPTLALRNDEATHWDNLLDNAAFQEGLGSIKITIATALAAYALYQAMLRLYNAESFKFFAKQAIYLPLAEDDAMMARERKMEM